MPADSHTRSSAWATRLALLYFVLATATLIWPLYPWLANRIEPRVWGLPFSLVWILGVITANFLVLVLLYVLQANHEHDSDREHGSP